MQILRNNLKAITLEQLPKEAWANQLGLSDDLDASPLLKRCVSIRSDSLSMIPLEFYSVNGEKIEEHPIYNVDKFSLIIKQIEKCLLKYSRAYVLVSEMRVLDPKSIENIWDRNYGLIGFRRTLNGEQLNFNVNELLYFYECSESETIPEKSSFACAKLFLQAYNNVVEFVSAFFRNGTVKSTLLYVEGMPTSEEKDRLKSFWQRAMQGVKNAFAVEVIRTKIEPISIGEGIDSLDISILDNITQQVLLAYGVPASLILPSAVNYATAEQDKFNFYENVVVPRALYIQSIFNAGLKSLGVQIYFNYQSMHIYQKSESERANSLYQLIQSGFTLLEAIDTIGYVVPESMRERLMETDRVSKVEKDQNYVSELFKIPSKIQPV